MKSPSACYPLSQRLRRCQLPQRGSQGPSLIWMLVECSCLDDLFSAYFRGRHRRECQHFKDTALQPFGLQPSQSPAATAPPEGEPCGCAACRGDTGDGSVCHPAACGSEDFRHNVQRTVSFQLGVTHRTVPCVLQCGGMYGIIFKICTLLESGTNYDRTNHRRHPGGI